VNPSIINHYVLAAADIAPDLDAFRFAKKRLSFADLARSSARLATVLQASGVRRGTKVGVCMLPSLEASIAFHGILWAGGVAVPMDPSAPAARHANIAQRTEMRHLIAHEQTTQTVAAMLDFDTPLAFVLGVDNPAHDPVQLSFLPWSALNDAPEAELALVDPEDLAYVIFTSGSTGVPKGVVHTHKSAAAYADASARIYALGQGDVVANHAPTHFDISCFGLYSAPSVAATTVIVPKSHTLFLPSLARLVQDEGITHWYSLSSAMFNLLSMDGIETLDLSALRWGIFGGDRCTNAQLRAVMQKHPAVTFSQSYGPTETNQCAYYHFSDLPAADSRHPCIGHVVPGFETHILDDNDQQVGENEIGTLWVSGVQNMTGYLDDDVRNAAVFRDFPMTDRAAGRFYSTGDQLAKDSDGLLTFHGRKDRLIKFRGLRLELDEVEAVLTLCPGVQDAAVFLSNCGTNLIAAIRLAENSSVTPADVQAFGAGLLPSKAVPTHIAILHSFPRTSTEKTDRVALQKLLDHSVATDERDR
jgi:amino acid adenylation domain-containing protein